jgi:hypothetical protein
LVNTGSDNTALGSTAGYSTTSGTDNTFIGRASAQGNTTGSFNVAVGRSALVSNTTSSYQTAVGYQAGYNTTGNGNCFFGYLSGYSNTTGVFNAFFGRNSGTGITTGYFHTIIGDNAGSGFTTGSVTNNTFLGASSGNVITSGSNNTIIGCYTGNQGGLDIRTANNYIVLSDGNGNPRGYFDNNGKFTVGGVGTYGVIGAAQSGAGGYCMGTSAANNGGTYYHMNFLEGSTGRGSITSNGSVTLYNTTSDQRLKENIVDAGSGLEKLANVKIRAFDWIENKAHTDFGVIAQELQIVAPEAVSKGQTEEDMMSVDTSALVPAMIKAIQELKAEVDSLKQQLGK